MYNKVIDLSWPAGDYATFQKAMIAGVSNGRQKIALLNTISRQYPASSLSADVNMEVAGDLSGARNNTRRRCRI